MSIKPHSPGSSQEVSDLSGVVSQQASSCAPDAQANDPTAHSEGDSDSSTLASCGVNTPLDVEHEDCDPSSDSDSDYVSSADTSDDSDSNSDTDTDSDADEYPDDDSDDAESQDIEEDPVDELAYFLSIE
jgi:hypothetical protein